ncbi:MAG: tRNA-dihydrouridine synthase, partial [Candidatus Omnitrophica bacterium]|nr:tRNA-dihydrouridine synthase [Candidatus Omnitrophota bacterium]
AASEAISGQYKTGEFMTLKIGNTIIPTNIILSPLSGCTDRPFRSICRDHGCKFAFFEMMDSSALVHSHKKTLKMMSTEANEGPIGAQILGSDPGMVLEACHMILQSSKPLIMDLNCACPAKKVIRKGAGSFLLKDQKRAEKIIKKMASELPVPVTVKLRSSFTKIGGLEGLKLAKKAQDLGVSAVFLHGRSMTQGYAGKVDYEAIRQVKQALKIPLIASGDILSPELAKKMLDETGCDGIAVARGSFGNPWIFSQIEAFLADERPPSPSYEDIRKTAKTHLELYREFREELSYVPRRSRKKIGTVPSERSERVDCPIFLAESGAAKPKSTAERHYLGHLRKIAMWYSKGLPYSKRAREAITNASSYGEIVGVLDRLKQLDNPWLKR